MQSKLKDASDWEETEILTRLVRVNAAQHRRADYFCRLQSVARCAALHTRLAAGKNARTLAQTSECPSESNAVGVRAVSLYARLKLLTSPARGCNSM